MVYPDLCAFSWIHCDGFFLGVYMRRHFRKKLSYVSLELVPIPRTRRSWVPPRIVVVCSLKPTSVSVHRVVSQVLGVLGCQCGDDGKGKLVDILAHHFDIVARCQVNKNMCLHSCSFPG